MILRHIRALARIVVGDHGQDLSKQWTIAQLRYAVHTIGFDEPNQLQRIWALNTASALSKNLVGSVQ